MSYFRCPGSSSLVSEASLYSYQPIPGLDESQLSADESEEGEQEPKTMLYTDNKRCWICFGEETDSEGKWVYPCHCSLISHEQCLLDWIAETQKITPLKKVACPQCSTRYVLSESHSFPLAFMSIVDNLVHVAAPYLTVLGLGCSMLITSSTLGAHSILTVFGTKEGERLIGNPAYWTWRTWLGLPSIPVALIAARTKWADKVLPVAALLLLKMTGVSYPLKIIWPPSPAVMFGLLPWVRLLYNNLYSFVQKRLSKRLVRSQDLPRRRNQVIEDMDSIEDNQARDVDQDTDILFNREGRDMSVTVIGALLWPTISSIVGG
ncbi:uncharacterized protein B0P05DRAFT_542438 [Gilbertella persicaria]|uniref:uncharacterized protein n=1 Tax=Gilbertella persicaria TaxID=101096 RepID=UPI0022200D02|nr:uncharacterized protein B0P05DRAFT_542438 [Gilbertella persicaria]KAI8079115.1 hypothetical protein B0P05DRAFT_542438 [Gilbertella persicaria]